MEIVSKGDYKTGWKSQYECTGKGWEQGGKPCHSVLMVENGDIFKRKYTDMSGEDSVFFGFICPVCGCFTEVDERKIPQDVLRYAKDFNCKN